MKKIIILALMASNLFGAVRYAKTNGSNAWTGRSPVYTSINSAVNACQSGDEVWVSGGHYVECNIKPRGGTKLYGGFDGDENSLSERGNPWNDIEKTTIDGNNEWTCIVITLGNNVVVDGFNIIRGHEGTGTYDRAGGVRVWGKTDVILRNLTIHDCYAAQGAGILIDTEQNFGSITVEYVIVYNCSGTCGAVEVANPTNPPVNISNCTIADNYIFGLEWAGSDEPYRMNHDWYNNIVWNNNNPRVRDVQENLWRWAREFSSDSYAGGER